MSKNFIFQQLRKHSEERPEQVFLEHIPSGNQYTFGEVFHLVTRMIKLLDRRSKSESVVLNSGIDLNSIVSYCAIVASGRIAVVVDGAVSSAYRERLLRRDDENLVLPDTFVVEALHEPHDEILDHQIPQANKIESVLFTSGSTGEPKIFGIPSDRPGSEIELDSFGDDYAVLNLRRPSTTPFRRNLRRALLRGGRFITTDLTKSSPSEIDLYLSALKIREISVTPTMIRSLFPHFKNPWTQNVQVIHTSGERLIKKDLETCFETFPKTLIHRVYGLTEFGEVSEVSTSRDELATCSDPLSSGRPLVPVDIRPITDEKESDGTGEGRIFVKGMSGYIGELLDDGQFSFEHFKSDEWTSTGDIGFFNEHQELVVLGRTQETLKIRGSRISILEVEEIIMGTGLVERVLVASYLDRSGNIALGALVVPKSKNLVNIAELRRRIVENHPLVKCPTRLIHVNEIPILASGKLDRITASQMLSEKSSPTHQEGEGETFRVVKDILCKILVIDSLPSDADVFEAGLDSLGSLEVVDQLSQAFGFQLDIRILLENPTCDDLVAALTDYMEPVGRVVEIASPDGVSSSVIYWILPGANPFMIVKTAKELPEYIHRGVLQLGCLRDDVLLPDVTAMVRCLVEAVVVASAPSENLIIGGFSSAGIIASEVARVLLERGANIRGLILLDPVEGKSTGSTTVGARMGDPVHIMLGREGRLNLLDPVSRDHALFGIQLYALAGYSPRSLDLPVLQISAEQKEVQKELWTSHQKSRFVMAKIDHLDYLRKPQLICENVRDFLENISIK